jgi:hypothetical protein
LRANGWRERREPEGIEAEIVACRHRGMNRYEIHDALREQRDTLPSLTSLEYQVARSSRAMTC